jgi:hypothetical protein
VAEGLIELDNEGADLFQSIKLAATLHKAIEQCCEMG